MKLGIVPSALAELHDAAAFYTARANIALGLAFVAEFERTASLALQNPLLGAFFRGSRRRYLFRRFPYSIIYQITNLKIVRAVQNQINVFYQTFDI